MTYFKQTPLTKAARTLAREGVHPEARRHPPGCGIEWRLRRDVALGLDRAPSLASHEPSAG